MVVEILRKSEKLIVRLFVRVEKIFVVRDTGLWRQDIGRVTMC